MLQRQTLRRALRPVYHRWFRARVRCRCLWLDAVESRAGRAIPAVPPALLRFRVAEDPDLGRFLAVGQAASQAIEENLARANRKLQDFRAVLDFGCGCGRTLRWLIPRFPGTRFWGSDVDREAIEWCRGHLDAAGFRANGPEPPLDFADQSFDLLYGISVFTHLSREMQESWTAEFARVLTAGGVLVLSFHGPSVWQNLPASQRRQVEEDGVLFVTSRKLSGLLPDWYHTAYHTPDSVRRLLSPHFRLLEYVPGGFGYQDAAIAEKL